MYNQNLDYQELFQLHSRPLHPLKNEEHNHLDAKSIQNCHYLLKIQKQYQVTNSYRYKI